ncbi:MAG: hypothetical protein HKO59_15105 [Phycisphaerales bacterium]|nr:sulfotransferase domain-containing protein [Phycisphaerae bacterium]NNF43246.1 hypothetical protein [Phycisphaerales bacterium]NNM27288.1 hypothetical protein [Phycisphaerales bacterium]
MSSPPPAAPVVSIERPPCSLDPAEPSAADFIHTAVRSIRRLARTRGRDHPHIVIACFPKSGSTFLATTLARATGFRPYLLNPIGHDTERDIRPLSIPMFLTQPTVSQEHMHARTENVRWLRLLGVRPVVLVRDVFDAVVSARDHVAPPGARGPAAHPPPDENDPSVRQDLAIRAGVPWMIDFFTSWRAARAKLDVHFVTYDELVADPIATIERIFTHVGMRVPATQISDALASIRPSEVRFNRGRGGRGRLELTPAEIRLVEDIAGTERDADLSMIGLPS